MTFAQEDANASSTGIADITVTAEKRETNVQHTAISLNVVDASMLRQNNVGTLSEIASLAPGVNYTLNNAATIFAIRGVSSRDTSEIGDPAVAVSIDGFNLQRSSGLNAAVFDLERVEVLRGPQGTLLGRNATGGAINIVTAKPGNELGGYIGATIGNYSAINTEGAINLPVNDWIKMRAAFQTRNHNGYRNNAPARDGDDEDVEAGRLHIQLDPTERLSILLTGEYAHSGGVGPVLQAIPWNFTPTGGIAYEKPDIPGDGKTFAIPQGGYFDVTHYSLRWNAQYDMGFASLTYLGGWRKLDYARLGTLGGLYGSVRQDLAFTQFEKPVSWNHEVRLASPANQPFMWQIGAFAFSEKNDLHTTLRDIPGISDLVGTPVNLQEFIYPDIEAKAKAVFGQVGYNITDTVKIEAGARYSEDKKHRTGYNFGTSIVNYYNTGAYNLIRSNQNSRTSSSKTTYHAAINWEPTTRNMLYAKFDTGYKAGGFTDVADYDPESITAYEIGSKNRFFDNKLQLNLAAYHYAYKDQQVSQVVVTSTGGVGSVVMNAGSTSYWGAEMDMIFQPTPADRLDAYVNYNHAEYKTFAVAVSGVNRSLAGNAPPQAPLWSANFGYQHAFELGDGDLTLRVQTHIESKSYFTFFNYDSDRQSAYMKSDVLLTYKSAKGWTLGGFVRNIEDKLIFANMGDPTSVNYRSYRYQYQPPRTYGAQLTVNF